MNLRSPASRSLAWVLTATLTLNPMAPALAQITVANGTTTLGQAGNGVPVVNIAAPNARGLSHNRFTDYNVGSQGLILNNATERTQSTQLGGIILGNPNLQGKAAGMILNEVTGTNPSQLRGYTEVAGQAARVIVANPHGISCDGCGFINTPRATLSTGRPILEDGRLDHFDVDGGQIAIEGAGLNASNIDQFDLITRSARINAEIHANRLNIVAGRNQVDADSLAATAKAGAGSAQPMLAIDSSALGGMYAGAIRLVGTEAGVGVKLAGDLAASAGDIRIDASGKLSLAQTAAAGDLALKAGDLDLTGKTYAGGEAEIAAQGRLDVRQSLAAAGTVTLQGAQVVNQGVVEAGVQPDNGRAAADLRVSAQQLRNAGTLIGNGQLDVKVEQSLDNRGGTLSGKSLAQVEAGHLDNRQGRVLAEQQLKIDGTHLDNAGGLLQSQGSVAISVREALDNRQGDIHSHGDLQLTAGRLDNREDGLILSQTRLDAAIGQLDNRGGVLSGRQALSLSAQGVDNRDQGLINSAGALALDADRLDSSNRGEVSAKGTLAVRVGELVQHGGQLIGEGSVSLDLRSGTLDNQGGLIAAGEDLTLSQVGELRNGGGELSSTGDMAIAGRQLDNSQGGRLIAAGQLALDVDSVDNSGAGLLSGWSGIRIDGASLDNRDQGTVSSRDGALEVNLSGTLDNSGGGALVSQGAQRLRAGSLDNHGQGILSSETGIDLNIAGTLNNASQGLISAPDLSLEAGQVLNQDGRIVSAGDLLLSGGGLDNSGGSLTAARTLSASLSGTLRNNSAGQLASGGPLVLNLGSLDNRGGQLASQGPLELFAASLDNTQGVLAGQGDMTLKLSGALINRAEGLIYSRQGGLTIEADSLINDAGTLQARGLIDVVIEAAASNQSGRILSESGDLELSAERLDNSNGGILASTLGGIKLALASLFDNRGGTTQAKQDIDLNTTANGQVLNAGGHLSAVAGNARIQTGTFDNQGGGLYAGSLLNLYAGSFANQGAAAGQGGKVAAHSIDFSLSGALNNAHGLIEAGDALRFGAASLDNRQGALRALGQGGESRLTTSGALDNRGGRIEVANSDLALTPGSLLNADGSILHLGSGNFGLASSSLVQAGGTLISNGALSVNAATWNHSGTLQARELTLDVGTFTQSASGQLLATQRLSARGGDWSNAGLIASDGSLELTLSGAYGGSGRLTSLGDLSLQGASLDLADAGSIAGGALSQLTFSGQAVNRGQLTADGDLTVRAASLINSGTLGSAENLRLYAPTLRNENGLIFSGGDMALRVNSFTNRFADVYSLGAIDLAQDDEGHAGALLENISATLESAGDLSLAVSQLINRKDVFAVEYEQASGQISVRCYDCGGDHHNVDYIAREVFESRVVEDSPSALLQSGADLNLVVGSLENRYSTIAAAGDLRIEAERLDNQGAATGQSVRIRTWNTGRVTDGTDERFRYNHINPYNAQALPKEVPVEALSRFTLVSDITEVTPTGVAAAAIIQAGGAVSVTVAGAVDNGVVLQQAVASGSEREAGTAVHGSTQPVVVTLNPQLPPDLSQQQVNPLELPGFSLPVGDNGLFRLSGQGGEQQSASAGHGDSLPAQQLQHAQGSPIASRPAGAHPYLIETNPALTELAHFLGSDYLLANLGYDPDQAQKRLGDGLYEQRLIREAVVARTGQRYLAGLSSDEAMYRYLMDNAVASKDALNLSVGVSLTADQVAALTHDIVWLEAYEVNGEEVLVPVLYLAQAEGRLAANGALIQGRDVTLISGGALNNQGTLRASGELDLSAQHIANSGLIEAEERLQLLATESIRNVQGGIINGRDVSLIAGQDILNARTVTSYSAEGRGFSQYGSLLDNAAQIEARGDLSLSAGRDIQNTGGALSAAGNAELHAGNDLVISAAQAQEGQMRQDKRHFWSAGQTTQHAADVTVGGHLEAAAGRDLAVIASRVQAGGDAFLLAGGDLTLSSAADVSHTDYRYRSSRKKIHDEKLSVRQQAAEVEAGGNLLLAAGEDLTLVASAAQAGGEAYLYAGGEVALLAAEDLSYSLYDKKKKGSFGRKKMRRDEVTVITQVGSQVSAGESVTLESGGDQTYQVAKLTSGGDLTLDSGGEIAFEGVMDLKQESHEKSKSSWAWTSAKGKGKTDETLRQSELVAGGELAIRAAGRISIDIKEVNAQTVSQTIDALVQADPQLAWLKEMEARGDVDWQRVKEVHDQWKYSHSGMGPGLALVVAIVVAAVTGPMMSTWIGSGAPATSALTAALPATATAAAIPAGWANVALTAAMSSAASNMAINTINSGGDLGEAFKLTFSGDAMKGYASAAVIAGLGAYTDMWGRTTTESGNTILTDLPERAKAYALNTAVKGVLTGASSSEEWATVAGIGLMGEAYQYWVGRESDLRPGVDRPEGAKFFPIPEDGFFRVPTVIVEGVVREGKNIGLNDVCTSALSICHGMPISNALNAVPGFNSFATLHDTWMNWLDVNKMTNVATNIGSMPPALILNYGSLANQYYWLKPTVDQSRENDR
ncbi:filamentous hemagglutinin N-terminal domain-containing protein [Pseudothauera nasutitermitis]|uniref:Filamentous hemagglutinin N-terminal domain-containing protein n=2 Tax=Pseudothauera nasutitermitis TaxID=2565930 RepID=A0A4S4AUI3_9RHOO|nr:filamentous hemagglutinin N-terminal domain-containing protein [Pseudothauera nasutitermitis]